MENENKNKNKHHRHKSYFISPNGEQKTVEKAETTQAAAESNHSNQNKPNNKHKNKNKTKIQNGENAANAPAKKPEVTSPVQNAENAEKAQSSRKNKRNRSRHKKHNDVATEPIIAPVQTLDPTPEKTEKTAEPELSFPKNDRLEKPAPKKLESFSSSPEFQKYQDYQEFTYEELYGSLNDSSPSQPVEENGEPVKSSDEQEVEVVGIRFKSSGKTYYFDPNGISLRIGSHAIVETARGLEYGEVVMGNSLVPESETVPPLRPVIRAATQSDILHNEEIKKDEENAFRVCNEKIIAHGLDMKLIDAQYTFDNTKLLFYFTSSGRVDFRELVKDLASVFRTRIELRQIGIRDEAKMVGGLGSCGRPLCCSIFLTDFGQVSIKMAKEQNLSLNSSKISGICGRLMCCLRYEHDTYEHEIKRTPPVDTLVRTVDGVGSVTEISPLQGTIKVRLVATPDVPPKSYKREDVTILKKKD